MGNWSLRRMIAQSGGDSGAVTKKAVGARRSSQLSVDDLLAAKKLVGAFGGTDKAIAALQALKRLEG